MSASPRTDAPLLVRPVRAGDAAGVRAVYAPVVTSSPATFEVDVPSEDEVRRRIDRTASSHPWLVAVGGDRLLGFASATPFSERAAYRWTVETSVYVADDARGRGIGTRLYGALLEAVAAAGFLTAVAKIALPNPGSLRLHAAHGFEEAGVLPRMGWKLGAWRDIALLHRDLAPERATTQAPAPPA